MKKLIIGSITVAVLSLGQVLPSFAYPAGEAPALSASSSQRLTPGDAVSVIVSRVKPGCSVYVRWSGGKGISPVSGTADSAGNVALSIASPTVAGRWILNTSPISAECAGGNVIVLTSAIYLGKTPTVAARISSTTMTAKYKPTLSVSGSVKFGSEGIADKLVAVDLKLDGKVVKKLITTTNSKGLFSAKFKGTKYRIGKYTAVARVGADSTYVSRKVGTAKINLK